MPGKIYGPPDAGRDPVRNDDRNVLHQRCYRMHRAMDFYCIHCAVCPDDQHKSMVHLSDGLPVLCHYGKVWGIGGKPLQYVDLLYPKMYYKLEEFDKDIVGKK